MKTKNPEISAAIGQLQTATKRCGKVLNYLRDSAAIIRDRAATEAKILQDFLPGNEDAIKSLALARTSQEIHKAGVCRLVENDTPAALGEAQAALEAAANALRSVASDERQALMEALQRALEPFGGSQEVPKPGGGTELAGLLAASAAAEFLPSLASAQNDATWPTIIWNRFPKTSDEAETVLNSALAALKEMQGLCDAR